MLTARGTARLGRRARRRRTDGARGLLARRALRRLGDAARRDDRAAVTVFGVWLDSLDDESWDALAGCPARAAWALATATEPARAARSRAAIGAFCTARDLAPDEPAARALFYVLTGQQAQHRAADPDGSLLAAAYQAGDTACQAAVRESLAGVGGLDLVRIVAGAPGHERRGAISGEERGYLVGQLTARGDWAGLWRLAPDLPLQRSHLWATSDGRCRVFVSGSLITVAQHPLTETISSFADQPLAALTPADGLLVAEAMRATAGGSPAWPLLDALAACVEHRFGTEVALGAPGRPRAAADDVALAGQP